MKNLIGSSILLLLLVVMSGCAPMPQNAKEFRAAIKETSMLEKESYVVKRPLHKIVKSFKKHAKKCFDIRVTRTTYFNNGGSSTTHLDYKPTLILKKKKAELHLQMKMSNAMYLSKPPKDGAYLFVVDAIRKSKNSTQIDIYKPSLFDLYKNHINGVKAWIKGRKGCPDITK